MTNSEINRDYYNNNLYMVDDEFLEDSKISNMNKMNPPKKEIVSSENEEENVIPEPKQFKNNSEEIELNEFSKSSSDLFENNNKEEKKDFNLKTTIAHLQGDLAYSIGVLISAIIINIFPNLRFFDSVCTFLFSYVALELTIPIFKEATSILMEGVHEGIGLK